MTFSIRSLLLVAIFIFVETASAGTLTGTFSPIAAGSNVNLTAEGKLDWVHWGLFSDSSLNRKATVASQIRDFTISYNTNLFFGAAYRYNDNYNGYTWLDGTQESSVTNTTTGVYAVGGFGPPDTDGFQIIVPADTTLKTLKVYVGTYAARGHFQATLSDRPTSYSDTTLSNFSNGPGGVYIIDFAANSAGQTLTIRWTISSKTQVDGNVTLQAATLSAVGANNPPFAKITSPLVNATFTAPANITVDANAFDPDGTISKVEFYRNGTKAGEDASSPFSFTMTNVSPGYYQLTANPVDNGSATSASRSIDVFVNSTGGTLNGSVSFPPASVNLTSEGNMDWVHWGLTNAADVNRKSAVPAQISSLTKIGTNTLQRLSDYYTALSWSDGTPTASTNNVKAGVFISGITNGFQLSVSADTALKTLKVYVGLYGGSGNFQSWLSDFSGPAFTDRSLTNAFGNAYAIYTVNYAAASAGQTLNIKYTSDYLIDQDFGNVALSAATLNGLAPVFMFNSQASSGNFSFSFQTELGRTYIVRYTDSLNPINWLTLTNVSGSGIIETVTDSASQPQRFYRVQTN
ncbi:MAG: Ig-like domain-containing protein [Verrucomicrobiota bacterium]